MFYIECIVATIQFQIIFILLPQYNFKFFSKFSGIDLADDDPSTGDNIITIYVFLNSHSCSMNNNVNNEMPYDMCLLSCICLRL